MFSVMNNASVVDEVTNTIDNIDNRDEVGHDRSEDPVKIHSFLHL